MNLPMFSCSLFIHFVSDPTRNPKTMSKRGQEQTSKEGSAVAKPKPMSQVQGKGKPRNLVSQVSHSSNRWSEKSSSATALSNPAILEKAMTQTSGVEHSFGKPERDIRNHVRHSQERTQENAQSAATWKQETVAYSDDQSPRKRERTVDTTDTEMEYCNMKITDYSCLSKVIMFLQQKLGVHKGCETFGIQASKTNIMMWRLFLSSSMRAAIHL